MINRLTKVRALCTRARPQQWLSRHWKKYEVAYGRLVVRCYGRKWWGVFPYEVLRGGVARRLHDWFHTFEDLAMMKKKVLAAGSTGPTHLVSLDTKLFVKLPEIIAHCAILRYDDGDARRPGEFRVRPVGALWCAEAIDYDAGARLQCLLSTWDDAIAGLNLLLTRDDAPWEECPWLRNQGPKKGKK